MPDPSPEKRSTSEIFRLFSHHASRAMGSYWAFCGAVVVVLAWAISGPLFHFSERWQLIINTVTTVVTFLMVFLVQSTQNRESKAIHLKLDEIIRTSKARNVFADLEDASEKEIEAFEREFQELRRKGHDTLEAVKKAHEAHRAAKH